MARSLLVVLALCAMLHVASGAAGCHKLFSWNPKGSCEEKYICTIGSSCDSANKRFCQENGFCGDGLCQAVFKEGENCTASEQCATGFCSLIHNTTGVCGSVTTQCGGVSCGGNLYCDREQNKCVDRIALGDKCNASLPNPSDVCEGGLSCAPSSDGGVCVALYSLTEGASCNSNASAQCLYGLECVAGVCTNADGASCSSGGDAQCGHWPNAYCSCQQNIGSGVQTCQALYNLDCAGKFQDLARCMAQKGCSFDTIGDDRYEGNTSCIATKCTLEYFVAECCKYSRFDWLYGDASPQLMPLGQDCDSGSPAGYLLIIILLVIGIGFFGVVVIAYRQFLSRASLYSRLSTVDDDEMDMDHDSIQLRRANMPLATEKRFDPLNGAW